MTILLALAITLAQAPQQQREEPIILRPGPSKAVERTTYHSIEYPPMSAELRLESYAERMEMERESIFANVPWLNVGPQRQGGRVIDFESPQDRPDLWYAGYATGGLWVSDDRGQNWESLFDNRSSFGIGDFTVSPDGQTIWLGTGENNSQRTSYSGTGVFVSRDGGQTWEHKGLASTHHVGRIVVDPRDPDTIYVGGLGSLYSQDEHRGFYRSTDGGETWDKTLYIDERTGVIEVVQHPTNLDTLFAVCWDRDRRAWNFRESGPGSGVYRSDDAGLTWTKVEGGLPSGRDMGRTAVAIAPSDPQVMYAFVDNQGYDPRNVVDEREPSGELTLQRFRFATIEALAEVPDDELKPFLRRYLPQDSDIDEIIKQIRAKEVSMVHLADLMLQRNEHVFDQELRLAEVYRSEDGGRTWTNVSGTMGSHGGYYWNKMTVHPTDPNRLYTLGVRVLKSVDGGRSWESIATEPHVDHHVFWIDPRNPNLCILGNDGGLYVSYDGDESWSHVNNVSVGQFTTIAVDNQEPYRIIGGLQDNGTMMGPANHVPGRDDPDEWQTVGGGDGSAVAFDPRGEVIYVASQFGNHSARNLVTGDRWNARPSGPEGVDLRFNWISPLVVSSHHPDIVYVGSQMLHRSFNQGRKFEAISGDLTKGLPAGDVPFSTLTQIAESPSEFGLIYVGADDGSVHVTEDGGDEWSDIATPATDRWVTRIVASQHDPNTVYVSQNGYRQDDWTPYVWASDDRGRTWRSIAGNLPLEPVNTIREDPKNPDVLYVGTDMGVLVTLDGGEEWLPYGVNLPHTPVHDLAIQEREMEMAIGTHARSVWVVSIQPIHDLTEEVLESAVYIWPIEEISGAEEWAYQRKSEWDKTPVDDRFAAGRYWAKSAGTGTVEILDKDGNVVKSAELKADRGFNRFSVSLMLQPASLPEGGGARIARTGEELLADPLAEYRAQFIAPGDYTLRITIGEHSAEQKLEIKE